MAVDTSLQDRFLAKKSAADTRRGGSGPGGSDGGDEPPRLLGEIVGRVAELERRLNHVDVNVATILTKLDYLAQTVDIERLRTEIATVAGRLETKAGAAELAELKGRVLRIPTVPTLVALGVLFSMLLGAARWAYQHFL